MKKTKGPQTFKFFIEWFFEFIERRIKALVSIVALGTLAFSANMISGVFHHPQTKAPADEAISIDAQNEADGKLRSPASIEKPITEEAGNRVGGSVSGSSSGSSASNNPTSSQGSSQSPGAHSAPTTRSYGNYPGAISNNPPENKSSTPGTPAIGGDQTGNTYLGGNFASPNPSQWGVGTAGSINTSSGGGTLARSSSKFPVAAGFQTAAGGGISAAAHCQARASVGGASSAHVQTSGEVMSISGIEGVYQQ
jgi:hypothetical protein